MGEGAQQLRLWLKVTLTTEGQRHRVSNMHEEAAGVCEARGVAVDLRKNHNKGLGTWYGPSKGLWFRKKPWDEK